MTTTSTHFIGQVQKRASTEPATFSTFPATALSSACSCILTSAGSTSTQATATTTITPFATTVTTIATATSTSTKECYTNNLVTNPGFETGNFNGWKPLVNSGNTYSVDTPGSRDSSFAAKVETNGPFYGFSLWQTLSVCIGAEYTVTYDFMVANSHDDSTPLITSINSQVFFDTLPAPGVWKTTTNTFVASTDRVILVTGLLCTCSSCSSQTYYFDNFSVSLNSKVLETRDTTTN